MRRSSIIALALGVALAATTVGGARATVLFNNTTQTAYGGDAVANNVYASFSTGSQGVDLQSVSFALLATNASDGHSFRAILRSDNVGNPGSSISGLGPILDSALLGSSLSSPSMITLTETTPIALAANTRYWIELTPIGAPPFTSAYWLWTNTNKGVGVKPEYTLNGAPGNFVTANLTASAVYTMNVSVVPEPGSTALLGIGAAFLLGLSYLRRRPV